MKRHSTPLRNSKGVNKPFQPLLSPFKTPVKNPTRKSNSVLSKSPDQYELSSSSSDSPLSSSNSTSIMSSSLASITSSSLNESRDTHLSCDTDCPIKKSKLETSFDTLNTSTSTEGNASFAEENIGSDLRHILCYKDLTQLKTRVANKEQELFNLKVKLAYAKKEELQDLPNIILKWRYSCQEILEVLCQIVSKHKAELVDMKDVIEGLQLPKDVLHYSDDILDFTD